MPRDEMLRAFVVEPYLILPLLFIFPVSALTYFLWDYIRIRALYLRGLDIIAKDGELRQSELLELSSEVRQARINVNWAIIYLLTTLFIARVYLVN